jgi:type IV pilus assembly protein PilO
MNLSELNNLSIQNAGSWPGSIKAFVVVLVITAVGALGYWLDTSELLSDLEAVRTTELKLRNEFSQKQSVMANIDAYRAQLQDLQGLLNTMLRQLPTGTEMPDLLEDISNTGKVNGLTFELFKPEVEQPRDFYAAKPISIRARGTYHQFAAFVSSIAALSRIVTLENATIIAPRDDPNRRIVSQDDGDADDVLRVEAILQTYRYLDDEMEPPAQQPTTGQRTAQK